MRLLAPRLLTPLLLAISLAGCRSPAPERTGPDWIIFRNTTEQDRRDTAVFPFFRFQSNPSIGLRDFICYPLVSGFHDEPDHRYRYSLPLLSFNRLVKNQDATTSGFISLPLLTFSRQEQSEDRKFSQLVSLPLLSAFYRGEYLSYEQDARIAYRAWNSLLGQSYACQARRVGASAVSLSVDDFSVLSLSGESRYDAYLFRHGHWDDEHLVSVGQFFGITLWEQSSFAGPYPGSRYSAPGEPLSVTFPSLKEEAPAAPLATEYLGLLAPVFSFTRSGDESSRVEILPFFTFSHAPGNRITRLLPLGLRFDREGPHFAPWDCLRRWYPLFYYQEEESTQDAFFSLFTWTDDPSRGLARCHVRLLFLYHRQNGRRQLKLLKGLLSSYEGDVDNSRRFTLLSGLLFSYQRTGASTSWSLGKGLLFGRERNPQGSWIKILFIPIRTGGPQT